MDIFSRNFEGPDHSASLEPEELTSMVQSIRNIEIARGTGEKVPTKKELSNLEEFRTRDRKNCRDKNIGRIEVFVES